MKRSASCDRSKYGSGCSWVVAAVNGFAGMVMGWLYARYGLLSAVLAHFLADVVGYAIPNMS